MLSSNLQFYAIFREMADPAHLSLFSNKYLNAIALATGIDQKEYVRSYFKNQKKIHIVIYLRQISD
mgnify:CR=1 FL=1